MHAPHRTGTSLAVLAALVIAGATLSAQPPDPSSGRSSFRFRSRAELINVNVTVTDRAERFVTGLRREDFRLYEDGVPQTITHFGDERAPVSLGLVVDASGSMEGEKWASARDAIGRFLHTLLGPDDEVFLMVFSDDVSMVEPWTTDRAQVSRALGRVRPAGGTSMYDAAVTAVPIAQKGSRRKKALLVISDGNDRNSQTTIAELRRAVRETEVLIYAVGIDGESDAPTWTRRQPAPAPPRLPFPFPPARRPPADWPGSPPPPRYPRGGGNSGGLSTDERVNESALRAMTDDSGGRTEIVRTVRDLGPATASIADELRRQYFLGYPPAAEKDGRWHAIRVEVPNRDYLVRARRGYMATP